MTITEARNNIEKIQARIDTADAPQESTWLIQQNLKLAAAKRALNKAMSASPVRTDRAG